MGKSRKFNPEYYRQVLRLYDEGRGVNRATNAFSAVFDRLGNGIDALLKILDDEKKVDKGNGDRLGG